LRWELPVLLHGSLRAASQMMALSSHRWVRIHWQWVWLSSLRSLACFPLAFALPAGNFCVLGCGLTASRLEVFRGGGTVDTFCRPGTVEMGAGARYCGVSATTVFICLLWRSQLAYAWVAMNNVKYASEEILLHRCVFHEYCHGNGAEPVDGRVDACLHNDSQMAELVDARIDAPSHGVSELLWSWRLCWACGRVWQGFFLAGFLS